MPPVGKVTSFVTRLGSDGPEVCVFAHPLAGVQFPAGTLLPDEDPCDGARREAYEETGLDGLALVRQVATVPARLPGAGLRHLIHFTTDRPTPDEWWVVTPDGGGLCWRCHWLPLDRALDAVHPMQRWWLETAQHHLRAATHPPARVRHATVDVNAERTIELFWAPPWSASRALLSWLPADRAPDDGHVQRAEAVTVTTDGEVVTVAEDGRGLWSMPGGRREPGELLDHTLRRELREEACAQVLHHRLLGFQRFERLDGECAGQVTAAAMFRAEVDLLPFRPERGTRHRRLLSPREARDLPLWSSPVTQRLLCAALPGVD
jgi:ADP-ribose pyrophosphatase YjhB (NUDIX family)